MTGLSEINELLIDEQAKQIAELDSFNKLLKSQLANSIPKERVEALVNSLELKVNQIPPNSWPKGEGVKIGYERAQKELKALLSNQPVNQGVQS